MSHDSIRFLIKSDLQRLIPKGKSVSMIKLWIKIFSPRFIPVLLVRISCSLYKRKLSRPFAIFPSLMNGILFGLEVTPRCKIGTGLFIPHTFGTVIGASRIGNQVTIFQGVTLGAKYADTEYTEQSRPVVGNDVMIGAGAKILGPITIGNNTTIAANSLVIDNVPDGSFMIGVPAIQKNR